MHASSILWQVKDLHPFPQQQALLTLCVPPFLLRIQLPGHLFARRFSRYAHAGEDRGGGGAFEEGFPGKVRRSSTTMIISFAGTSVSQLKPFKFRRRQQRKNKKIEASFLIKAFLQTAQHGQKPKNSKAFFLIKQHSTWRAVLRTHSPCCHQSVLATVWSLGEPRKV